MSIITETFVRSCSCCVGQIFKMKGCTGVKTQTQMLLKVEVIYPFSHTDSENI